jgi:hypothetical protein
MGARNMGNAITIMVNLAQIPVVSQESYMMLRIIGVSWISAVVAGRCPMSKGGHNSHQGYNQDQ